MEMNKGVNFSLAKNFPGWNRALQEATGAKMTIQEFVILGRSGIFRKDETGSVNEPNYFLNI